MDEKYIKAIHIRGYKKFVDFHIEFKKGLNILIGENSIGKSTVLEAINIVLNQYYFGGLNEEDSQQLNKENIYNFFKKNSPSIQDLPSIEIEIELSLNDDIKNQSFYGSNYDLLVGKNEKYGIKFKFSYDEVYDQEFYSIDFSNEENHVIPLEYYHAVWTTFSGIPYKRIMNPLKTILIDSSINKNDVYGNYARNLYKSSTSEENQRKLSYDFSKSIRKTAHENEKLLDIGKNRSFAVDEKKSKLSNLIEIQENEISLRNMGKGEENILKTSLSLQEKTNLDLVMLEEPENHLSYNNTRKQINKIQEKEKNVCQIIATTHESMILNKLNLVNAIWIKENNGQSLEKLPKDDVKFFAKSDNFDILRYILGNKIILVEGASEFILLPAIINSSLNINLDKEKISIISMRGIFYTHFKSLASIVNKKTLILTDNDSKQDRIDSKKDLSEEDFMISMPECVDEFTFEAAIYYHNEKLCEEIIQEITKRKLSKTAYNQHKDLPIPLAAMLARKTEFALKLAEKIEGGSNFEIPQYIEEGVKWLVQ